MLKKMLNINGNLISEVEYKVIKGKEGEIKVANFTLFRKMKDEKSKEKTKEYINCSIYGEKTELTKGFEKGDFIHVYGYYKEIKKEDKTYKNFIVKHVNKKDKTKYEENAKNMEEN